MTYKVIIHTHYDNYTLMNIIECTKHYYRDSTIIRHVYETDNGMAIIFNASNPNDMISGIVKYTKARFDIMRLGFVDSLKVRFGTYVPDDKKKEVVTLGKDD